MALLELVDIFVHLFQLIFESLDEMLQNYKILECRELFNGFKREWDYQIRAEDSETLN